MKTDKPYHPQNFTLPGNYTLERTGNIDPYVFNNKIAIAVDIALATRRPLLVAGAPGSGKSRLAEAMAALLKWNYLSYTMTSHTRLEDLTADYDHLQRLHDAHTRSKKEGMKPDWSYFKPGLFWWAFNQESARYRSGEKNEAADYDCILDYPGIKTSQSKQANKSVLLIDEIDKAEPDLPNDLLEPLDRQQFTLPNGKKLYGNQELEILTIITTNRERDLPAAFMRRCVSLVLDAPNTEKLKAIAHHHFKDVDTHLKDQEFSDLVELVAAKIEKMQQTAEKQNRRAPSTSEFLDAVRAGDGLKHGINNEVWKLVEQAIEDSVLIKDLNDKDDSEKR